MCDIFQNCYFYVNPKHFKLVTAGSLAGVQVRILLCYGRPEFESLLVDLSSILPPSLSPKFSFCHYTVLSK